MSIPRPGDKRFQILNYVGIVDQLATTVANRLLAADDLPLAQFVMLNHFSHEPARGQTVMEVARAFQTQQAGITKMLQRLVKKGYLRVEHSREDRRLRIHCITEQGLRAHADAIGRLMPEIARTFAQWQPADIDRLHGLLFRLKDWLDRDRDREPG